MVKLAGECLDLNDETGGKAGPYTRLKARQFGQGPNPRPEIKKAAMTLT